MAETYDTDVAIWAVEQAAHIRARRFELLDLEYLADEIEDVGKSERRELASRMAVALAHWLKLQHQPERRGLVGTARCGSSASAFAGSWRRCRAWLHLLTDPEWIEDVWGDGVTEATKQTGLDVPEPCPWKLTDLLLPDWVPT